MSNLVSEDTDEAVLPNTYFASVFINKISGSSVLRHRAYGEEEVPTVDEGWFRTQPILVHDTWQAASLGAERACQCPSKSPVCHLQQVMEIRYYPLWLGKGKCCTHLKDSPKGQPKKIQCGQPSWSPWKNLRVSPLGTVSMDFYQEQIIPDPPNCILW